MTWVHRMGVVGPLFALACGSRAPDEIESCRDLQLGERCSDEADAGLVGEDGDTWFGSSVGVGNLAGDRAPELIVTVPRRGAGGIVLVYPGSAEDLGVGTPVGTVRLPDAGAASALYADAAPDLDGDGRADLLVLDANGDGAVYVASGPIAGEVDLDDAATAVVLPGDYPRSIGSAAGLGDHDGDGFGDLVIGDPRNHNGVGYVHLFDGPVQGDLALDDADRVLWGGRFPLEGGERAGTSVDGAGDVDGDGLADLVVGAPGADPSAPDHGAVYVLHGPIPDRTDLYDGDAVLLPAVHTDGSGEQVAGVGDVDGDGLADIAVGAPSRGAGAAYVVPGNTSGLSTLLEAAILRCEGPEGEHDVGATLGAGGDVDGDGLADILVGGSSRWSTDAGVVWIVPGAWTGTVDLSEVPTVRGGVEPTLPEEEPSWGDQLGAGLVGVGDLDGDGLGEVLLGSPGHDDGRGAVRLFLGATLF